VNKGETIDDDDKRQDEISQQIEIKKKELKVELGLRQLGFIENLTEITANDDEKFIGREKEIDRCLQILCKKKKKNLVIVGESGTGKTQMIRGIVKKILNKNVPRQLYNSEIFSIDISSIVSGTKYRGQFEERFKKVIDFFSIKQDIYTNYIVFIDEIHTLVGAGMAEGSLDAIAMLKPKLTTGEIQCIGATTPDEYRKKILKDLTLSRRFTPVFLNEASIQDTIDILEGIKKEYEEYHCVRIGSDIISTIVDLSSKYIKTRFFPDKAIDILDECCSRFLMEIERSKDKKQYEIKDKGYVLPERIIYDIVSDMSQIPLTTMTSDERNKLSNLENKMISVIVGQDKVIKSTVKSIQISRLGFREGEKPIGVFLFLGSTGTGKTLLAKTLSEKIFGTNKIIRLDMSEYMESCSVSKIAGANPGYIGYDEGGQLAEAVRKRPYSVILLDEIEKAHPQVINIFLQIFDEGRLTDSAGRYIDFRNTIIIMTSNIATAKIGRSKHMGFLVPDEIKENKDIEKFLLNEVKSHFPPEFINRIDEIMVFNKFSKENIKNIFEIEFNKSKDRLKEKGYSICLQPSAKDFICKTGHDEKYGARPMKRSIKKYIEEPVATLVFSGELKEEGIVYVSYRAGEEFPTYKAKNKK
jgi:ATP-dependent Clp protease ATP-binding subunit ClpC